MPITKSAKKALHASLRKAEHNERRRRAMKEAVKTVRKISATKGGDGREELSKAYKAIDKAAKTGVIKKGAASRKKSRLAKALKKAAGK